MRKLNIFISHYSQDVGNARRLKKLISELFGGTHNVFLSDDLPGGTEWFKEIDKFLKKKPVPITLVLATKRSIQRPWVWFEAGASWHAGSKVIPIRASNVRKLPDPLAQWTDRLLTHNGLTKLCMDIADLCGANFSQNHVKGAVKGVFPKI